MSWSFATFWTYLFDGRIALGALATIAVASAAQIVATLIGFAVALALRSGFAPLSLVGSAYIWLFRGTPPLIQLLLFYFGLPQLGLRLSVLEAGLTCLSLYAGAYMAEIVRAGLDSVDKGQVEAARSIGFSRSATLLWIVLPQAMRVMLPPFGNEFTSMMRTTSLLSVISFEELLRVTTLAINETFRPLELYAVAAVYYLAMTTLWMMAQTRLERRFSAGVGARSPNGTAGPVPRSPVSTPLPGRSLA
jgi:polar amino acid transport system permease protein